MKRPLQTICLLVLAACATPQRAASPPTPAPSSAVSSPLAKASVEVPEPPCPPIDPAALEPAPPVPDPRKLALSDLFPREEPRSPSATRRRWDLGRVGHPRREGDPGGSVGFGMGWQVLSESWVSGALRTSVASPFTRWQAAQTKRSDAYRVSYLLEERANRLRAIPHAGAGEELRCATRGRKEADAAAGAAEREGDALATALLAVLEAESNLSAGERLLLGYLLAERAFAKGSDATVAERRANEILSAVGADEKAPLEIRARAYEQVAKLTRDPSKADTRVKALERVVSLTKDPDLEVETLVKLGDLATVGPAREKLLERTLQALDHGKGGWRVAETLSKLAESELARGAFELAQAHAARCGREVASDFADDPDPWGCAATLATAMNAVGGAPKGIEVPLPFLGPLAFHVMQISIVSFDRDEARRAGEMLLAQRPEAGEIPKVLDLLAQMTRDSFAKEALLERRARLLAPESAWLSQQRERLASKDADALEKALAELAAPPDVQAKPSPTNDTELRSELVMRAWQLTQVCTVELRSVEHDLPVRIDTKGTLPKLTVTGASQAASQCLARAAEGAFRSLGPAEITLTLFAQ